MKKNIFLLSLVVTVISSNAQEAPPQIRPQKNVIPTTLPQLPKQPIKLPIGGTNLPSLADKFTMNNWQLIRWWVTGNIAHSIADPFFKFLKNGIVSCSLTTPEAATKLESGTYTIHGNNVTILLKKDTNVTMNCDLVYNNSSKIFTGTYTLQVLPIANTPTGYTPGTVTGDMKLEIKP
jgi:hypothetical protein